MTPAIASAPTAVITIPIHIPVWAADRLPYTPGCCAISRLALAPLAHANGAHRTPGSVMQHNGVSNSEAIEMIPSTSEVVAPLWLSEPGYGAPYAGVQP